MSVAADRSGGADEAGSPEADQRLRLVVVDEAMRRASVEIQAPTGAERAAEVGRLGGSPAFGQAPRRY